MTRFAKRNVTGPQKKPLDATGWKDMKTNKKHKQKERPNTEEKLHSILKTEKKDQQRNKFNKNKTVPVQYQKRVCFKCQQPGHKMSDCPMKGNTEHESELSEVKERWKKEKRSDWRRQKRQKVKESKMVSSLCCEQQ